MVRDLHPEYREGLKAIAKLPEGEIAEVRYFGSTLRIIYEDGRIIDIPTGQDN